MQTFQGKRVIFALLAHKDEHVVKAQLDNIRHYNPNAAVVLYNGGKDDNFGKSLGVPICPYRSSIGWGKQVRFFWDIMKWLEEMHAEYEYLVSLDSDILFVKHGFESYLDQTMAGYDVMGWDMRLSKIKEHRKQIVVKSMEREWHLWKPFFRTKYFIQYFNPTQVFRHGIIQRMLSAVDWKVAERMMNNTHVFALEEVYPATLAMACGGRCRNYPRDHSGEKVVRVGNDINIEEAVYAQNHPFYYWIHPVKGDALIKMNRWLLQEKARSHIANEKPLVSVLIPAYNRPHYLIIALQSVLKQTYPNIEIIICDDSTNDDVQAAVAPYTAQYPHVKYYKNEVNLDIGNWKRCLALASGEYINYLHDDDVFHAEKIERMMAYFMQDRDVNLVTSYRQPIDEKGDFLNEAWRISTETVVMDGKKMGDFVLSRCANMIGEPSCVLFKKSALTESFGIYKRRQYYYLNDLASWIPLLAKGKGVYIHEALSYFRCHEGQNQHKLKVLVPGILDWFHLLMASRKDGFLQNNNDYCAALRNFINHICPTVIRLAHAAKQSRLLKQHHIYQVINRARGMLREARGKRNRITRRFAKRKKMIVKNGAFKKIARGKRGRKTTRVRRIGKIRKTTRVRRNGKIRKITRGRRIGMIRKRTKKRVRTR